VVTNLVRNTRKGHDTGDNYRIVHMDAYSRLSLSDPRLFLRFDFSYELLEGGSKHALHRMLCWGHLDLTPMLRRRGVEVYIDGTFRSVPKPFSQCVIIAVLDDDMDLLLPILFSLVNSKNSWTYWHILNLASILTKCQFVPR
jgi:hypothetical protein